MRSNDERRALLLNFIEYHMPLNPEQQAEFRRLIDQPDFVEVKNMITSYERRGIERGLQQALLRVMTTRFGAVPADTRSKVEAIGDTAILETLLDRSLTAPSIEAMGLTAPGSEAHHN